MAQRETKSRARVAQARRMHRGQPHPRPASVVPSKARGTLGVIRIILADDHALFRAGMRAILKEMPDVDVVADVSDGHDALRVVAEAKPDLAILDISMPGLNGLEVAARIARDHRATRSIMLSMYVDDEYVRRALAVGAAGYLL